MLVRGLLDAISDIRVGEWISGGFASGTAGALLKKLFPPMVRSDLKLTLGITWFALFGTIAAFPDHLSVDDSNDTESMKIISPLFFLLTPRSEHWVHTVVTSLPWSELYILTAKTDLLACRSARYSALIDERGMMSEDLSFKTD